MAHEAPTHEHADLVPVPEYSPPYGEASAAVSLQVAQVFLASFDEATRAQLLYDLDAGERAGRSDLPAWYVRRRPLSHHRPRSGGGVRALAGSYTEACPQRGATRLGPLSIS